MELEEAEYSYSLIHGIWICQSHLCHERNYVDTKCLGQTRWKPDCWSNMAQGAIKLSNNNKFHACTTHIDVWYHFIWEAIENKVLDVQYVPTDENIADIFTKGLARPIYEKFQGILGLCYTWGGVLKYWQAYFILAKYFFLFTFYSNHLAWQGHSKCL